VFSPAGRICNGQTPIATAIVDPASVITQKRP